MWWWQQQPQPSEWKKESELYIWIWCIECRKVMEIIVHCCRCYNLWCCRRCRTFFAFFYISAKKFPWQPRNYDNICFRSQTHLIKEKKKKRATTTKSNTSDNWIVIHSCAYFMKLSPFFCFHIYSWLQIIINNKASSSSSSRVAAIKKTK